MYLLPYSGKEALVEYTLFSPELLKQESYYSSIAEYLEKYYNLKNYEVTHEERGAIPMTDYAFPSGDGQSVIYLGSAAGMSKASTGYTFYRIQKHSRQIIKQLERRQSPALAQQQSTWKLKMDRLMLHLMLTDGSNTWKIFQEMFENNPVGRVLSFLNEETSYMEDFLIMNSVPSGPFIKALMETGLKLN
jgi:lycopene beta-cyclase